ncbi:MAG: tRNA uridine-5-carboxymethylaminomethyl(34) synthesis GTPase MnmE [bacterium]|nr:tRNA uridine-5-carboxymethylaminomethyl(34) synthesis GTPase MnmE [bacterium]
MRANRLTDSETIIAVSTAPGTGAVGMVRLSGPGVLAVLKRHCRSVASGRAPDFAAQPRTAIFCRVFAGAKQAAGSDAALPSESNAAKAASDPTPDSHQAIDEGLVTFFAGPAAYTGEDTAELSLHGNPLILQEVVAAILEASAHSDEAPVRPAGPGEFTRLAYLNGRLELTRAEAVHRMITARTHLELAASRKNLYGELSRLVSRFRSAIIHLKAETEAEVDFSTEDLTFESLDARKTRVRELVAQLERIIERGRETERLRAGVQVALVGVPNAGKSSLLNRMLGWDRSIVSPAAGTTRDYVSEEIELDGVALRFVDTAGLRDTEDQIEEQGVRLSRRAMQQSQIVLHIIDGEREAYEFPELESGGTIVHVFNKSDIRDAYAAFPEYKSLVGKAQHISVSCANGDGFDALRELIRGLVFQNSEVAENPLLLEDRHRYHFTHVKESLAKVLELWDQGAPDEITALEIDRALEHTGAVAGRIDNEEVLGRIFSVFCVGK